MNLHSLTDLSEYKRLDSRWHAWSATQTVSQRVAVLIFEQILAQADPRAG